MFDLQSHLYRQKIPAIFLFEGWDAAGKGGCINRVCQSLDPRGYQVRQISAPSEEERQYHYLWRFWRSIPKTGHITILTAHGMVVFWLNILNNSVQKRRTDSRIQRN